MKVICGLVVEMTEYSDSSSSNHILANSDESDIGEQNQSDDDIENDLDIN
jgi:hypothetical protein